MNISYFEIDEIKIILDKFIENNDYENVFKLDDIDNKYHNICYACCYDDKYLPIIKILENQYKIDYLLKNSYGDNNLLEKACLCLSKEIIKFIFNKMIEIPSCNQKFKDKNDNDLTYCFSSLAENLNLEMMKFLRHLIKY